MTSQTELLQLQSQYENVITKSEAANNKNAALIPTMQNLVTEFGAYTSDVSPNPTVLGIIQDLKTHIALIKKNTKPLKPTLAKTNTDGTETNAPVVTASGDAAVTGQPTTPGVAAGSVEGTLLDKMNNSLSHVCDFSLEVQKNNALRLFLVAQAKNIREGVRAVMKALGFSDSTGQYQWLFDRMKDITRALKWLQRNVIQPVLDFEKYVVSYIKKIQEIIAWILSLPAKLLALLKNCLAKLYKLISNLMTAVASDLSEGGTGETGFSDVVSAAKEAATTALQTAKAAAQAAAGAVAIATVASALPNLVSPLKKGV